MPVLLLTPVPDNCSPQCFFAIQFTTAILELKVAIAAVFIYFFKFQFFFFFFFFFPHEIYLYQQYPTFLVHFPRIVWEKPNSYVVCISCGDAYSVMVITIGHGDPSSNPDWILHSTNPLWKGGPVGWICRIHWLLLYRWVRPLQWVFWVWH